MSIVNDPDRAGARASRLRKFGHHGRFAVYAVHTRGDAVQWFVQDAETPDPLTGLASVIGQYDDQEQALFHAERLASDTTDTEAARR